MTCGNCIHSTFKGNSKMGDCTFVIVWPIFPESFCDRRGDQPRVTWPAKQRITRHMGDKCKTFSPKRENKTINLNLE